MSTFLDTYCDGYKVAIRPHEGIRKLVHYHNGYLPYMDGQQIGLDLKIEAISIQKEEDIRFEWNLIQAGGDQLLDADEFVLHISPKGIYNTMLATKFLIVQNPTKYILNIRLTRPNVITQEYNRIAVLSVKDRGDMTMTILPILISATISVIALILSILSLILSVNE
ncbi:hypothetical protein ACFLRP_03035 [Bacteroidota bacterium]